MLCVKSYKRKLKMESSCANVNGGAVNSSVSAMIHFIAAAHCMLTEDWPPQTTVQDGSRFDFIVVGAGTAGSTLGARLSQMNATVLIVESGGNPPQESIIPGFMSSLKRSTVDWNFTSVNDYSSSQSLQDGVQRQPRGRMLGGTGSMNDMVYSRGSPHDYEEWASELGDEWSWKSVLPYFKKTEHLTDERILSDPELMKYHSRGGEIEVAGLNISSRDTDMFLSAFEELGYAIVKDMTNPNLMGAGRFSHTIRNGHRDSSLTGLLNVAAKKKNVFVLKESSVTNIIIDGNTAVGVNIKSGDKEIQVFANKEVIVSAGTFNTPKLLMLSGIGPKEHLDQMGIETIIDLPVGGNLHDHVMVLNYISVRNGTCDKQLDYFELLSYLYDRKGSLSRSNSIALYLPWKNSSTLEFAIYPTCVPINSDFKNSCLNILGFNEFICEKLDSVNKKRDLLSIAIVLLKPKSRGKVRLKSNNAEDEPMIYSGTFSDSSDLDGFPEAIEVVKSLTKTKHFSSMGANYIDLPIENCDRIVSEDIAKCKLKAVAMSAWHSVGTAAMGLVLDERMQVIGLDHLRVVDASVMPKVMRGNTNAPVVMIAEKAADFIKEDHDH